MPPLSPCRAGGAGEQGEQTGGQGCYLLASSLFGGSVRTGAGAMAAAAGKGCATLYGIGGMVDSGGVPCYNSRR